jgi:hypothetical protein
MGFAQESDEISPRPVCVLCNEVLQSTSSVPSKLNRPSEIQHSKHTCKAPSFPRVLSNPWSVKAYTHTEFKFENENALTVSLKFIYCITREDEEHKKGKILVKFSATYLTAGVGEEEGARKNQLLPLSDYMNQGELNLVQRMYWMN